jgi:hypothetical protein
MSDISFPMTLSELEQGETLGYGFGVGEVWGASDFDAHEIRSKIEGRYLCRKVGRVALGCARLVC